MILRKIRMELYSTSSIKKVLINFLFVIETFFDGRAMERAIKERNPRPPSSIKTSKMTKPVLLKISMETVESPVTHTAEIDVKRASI